MQYFSSDKLFEKKDIIYIIKTYYYRVVKKGSQNNTSSLENLLILIALQCLTNRI